MPIEPIETLDESFFLYRGCRFACTVTLTGSTIFLPQVEYLGGMTGLARRRLPQDAEAYGTRAEAKRHAQQQAMRWVNECTAGAERLF